VWTLDPYQAYAEFLLHDRDSERTIFFNHPGWNTGHDDPFVIVDGLQRLTTIRMRVTHPLPSFGGARFQDFDDHHRTLNTLRFAIADLPTESAVFNARRHPRSIPLPFPSGSPETNLSGVD